MQNIKKISLKDIIGIFLFLILIIPSFITKKIIKKKIWLISEGSLARDNGYAFFKYMSENHPKIKCYYAIDFKCNDYKKLENFKNIVNWKSVRHYFYFMSAEWNISSHKNGNPNHLLFSILLKYFNLYNNRVFLQHGITYNDHKMFYKKNAKFKIFIVGAKPETKFIEEKFGYDNGEVEYTGFARFDNLHEEKKDNNIILFMPTWRRWLVEEKELSKSNYFKTIQSLINSKELDNLLEKTGKKLYFCAHSGLKKSRHSFFTNNKNVKILDIDTVDVQKLLISASLLITDYSSIFFDFSYMKKPVIYYHFDEEEFLEKHIRQEENNTYFDISKDGFGDVIKNEENLLNKIEFYIRNNFELEEKFKAKIDKFFELNDNKNCERIYNKIEKETKI